MSKVFLKLVALILCVTALAKFWSVGAGTAAILDVTDPLIGLRFRFVMLIAAVMEVCVAMMCLVRRPAIGLAGTLWISSAFILYRIGLWSIGWHRPCSCLGDLTSALHISSQAADNMMKGVLAFMLVGSTVLLAADRWKADERMESDFEASVSDGGTMEG